MSKKAIIFFLLSLVNCHIWAQSENTPVNDGVKQRQYWIEVLNPNCRSCFKALSKNYLRLKMPVEQKDGAKREYCTHLEAFGRLLDGLAPWLELGPDNTPEGQLRKKYIDLAVTCIKNGVLIQNLRILHFWYRRQSAIVDAAFLQRHCSWT